MTASLVAICAAALVLLTPDAMGMVVGLTSETSDSDEGKQIVVVDRVEYLRAEVEDWTVTVGLRRHAQVLLYKGDPEFKGKLTLLHSALADRRRVRLTVREYGGRILRVELLRQRTRASRKRPG